MVLVVVLSPHPSRHPRCQGRRQHRPVERLPHVSTPCETCVLLERSDGPAGPLLIQRHRLLNGLRRRSRRPATGPKGKGEGRKGKGRAKSFNRAPFAFPPSPFP